MIVFKESSLYIYKPKKNIMYVFLLVLAAVAIFNLYRESEERKDETEVSLAKEAESVAVAQEPAEASPSSAPLPKRNERTFSVKASVMQVLLSMGCQIEEEDNKLYTGFQGEVFCIVTSETSPFITINDKCWYSVSLDDIDAVARLREAINYVNGNYNYNVVYNFNEKQWEMEVHTHYTTLWIKEIPRKDAYLRTIFMYMLKTHQDIFDAEEEFKQIETTVKA